jgi:uncharacterized protein (DUF983 family)
MIRDQRVNGHGVGGGRATGTRTDKPELKPVVASSGVNARGPRCGTARAFGRFLSFFLSLCVCGELSWVQWRADPVHRHRVAWFSLRCAVGLWP